MKKSLKAFALAAATGALVAGSALTAMAASVSNGQWCQEKEGWWYKLNADGSTFLANTWYWIKDADGVVRCYYFDENGWLQTNKTIGSEQVDETGRWVVNGAVQTADETKDYATSIDFAATASSNTDNGTAVVSDNKDTGASPISGGSANTSTSAKKGKYKASGGGDNPSSASFTNDYESAKISGNNVTSTWAGYSITLPSTPTLDISGAGTDWYYDADPETLICSYIKLDKYKAGNTDLNTFISGLVADKRGFYKGETVGQKTLGDIQFTELRAETPDPAGVRYDYCYVRVIPGTNFAQVIVCDLNGGDNNFSSTLATIKAL